MKKNLTILMMKLNQNVSKIRKKYIFRVKLTTILI